VDPDRLHDDTTRNPNETGATDLAKLRADLIAANPHWTPGELESFMPTEPWDVPIRYRKGWLKWQAYRNTPEAERNPPGLTAADFARPFLDEDRARREAKAREQRGG
jgi:hypothetical protein